MISINLRRYKNSFVSVLLGIILILSSLGVGLPFVHAQTDETLTRRVETHTFVPELSQQLGGNYRAKTFALSDGTLVIGHTINGPSVPPSGFEAGRQMVALPELDGVKANAIIGITTNASGSNGGPLYSLGCSPTAASDILKTDEESDFPNIVLGTLPPDGSEGVFIDDRGVSYNIKSLIATRRSMEYLWHYYHSQDTDPVPGGQDLSVDQVGPLMFSSIYNLGDFDHDGIADHNYDGDTTFFTEGFCGTSAASSAAAACPNPTPSSRPFTSDKAASENLPDGTLGLKRFYEARGYKVAEAYNQPTDNVVAGGFSFAQFKAEIDSGRPVMMHLGGESGKPGHSIVGIGYDASTTPPTIYLHDGWDYDTHTMTWGGNYPLNNPTVPSMPLLMVSIVHPIPPDHPGDYTISGYVGVPNATITFTGSSTSAIGADLTSTSSNVSISAKTDVNGYYSASVPPGWSGTVTPSKPGYTFTPAYKNYINTPDYQTKQNYTVTLIPNSNLLKDPSFELGSPNPYWVEDTTPPYQLLCDTSCGSGAHTGSSWAWFGGVDVNETGSLSQFVTIPKDSSASLDFYLWIGDDTDPGSDMADIFTVKVGSTTVFSVNATQINSYSTYIPVSVDVSAYADGKSHEIEFSSVTTGQVVSFHLDDVSLTTTPVTYTISGNAGVGGATLSYTDGTPKTVTADGAGNYSITVPAGWSGTVTPSLATDAFCPASQTYANVTASRTGQNYAHDACRTFDPISKWTSAFDLSHGWTVASYVRTAGDVNNDGKDDLVGFGQDGVYVALSNGTSFDPISKWTSAFDLSHGWTVASYVRTVGDVNNDGRADLVGFGQDGVYVALSNGTSFDAISKWTSAFDLSHGWTVKDYVRTVGDVNNDGRADLVGFGQDGVYVALSNGTSFGAISKWTSAFDLSHGWTVKDYVRTVGDVNNDGRADLIGFGQDGVYVALSNGTSFDAISKWTSAFDLSHGWTVKDYVRTVGDVNNDGRVDLIGFGQDGVYIALSMGTTFSLPSRRTTSFDLAHGWTVASYVRTVGDVSGDGKADLVGFGLDGVYVVK